MNIKMGVKKTIGIFLIVIGLLALVTPFQKIILQSEIFALVGLQPIKHL